MNIQEVLDQLPLASKNVYLVHYKDFILKHYLCQENLKGYIEKHHIIPVSFGTDRNFTKQRWNKISLKARDHFTAHKLLWMAYGEVMAAPYFQMSVTRGFNINAQEYEKLREDYSIRKSKQMKGKKRAPFTEEHKLHIAQAASNRVRKPYSEETKEKMRKAWEKRKQRGWTMSQEQRDKLSKLNKGKKITEETKKKISNSIKGSNHWTHGLSKESMPMFGKHQSLETREKISKAETGISKPAHLVPCPLCGRLCQAGGSLKSHYNKCRKDKNIQAEVGTSSVST